LAIYGGICLGLTINIDKLLCYLVGIFVPLVAARLSVGSYEMPLYLIPLNLLFIKAIMIKMRERYLLEQENLYPVLLMLSIIVSALFSQIIDVSGIIKMALNIFIYFQTIVILKTINENALDIIFKAAILSCSAYLIVLIYIYIIEFNVLYIGVNLDHATKEGRNSLAFMLAFMVPISIQYLSGLAINKSKILLVCIIVNIFGAILTQSRGLIIAIIISTTIAVINLIRKGNWRTSLQWIVLFSAILLFMSVYLPDVFNSIYNRYSTIGSIFQGDDIGYSAEVRIDSYKYAFETFDSAPILGIGYSGFMESNFTGKGTHNDYLKVFSELGLFGLFIFFLIFKTTYKKCIILMNSTNEVSKLGITFSVITIFIYIIFINALETPLFWLALGMLRGIRINVPQILGHKLPVGGCKKEIKTIYLSI